MRRPGGGSSYIGLALGDRECAVAEVSEAKGSSAPLVTRVGKMALTASNGPGQPQAMGAALKEFLKKNGYSASRVVVGLPARWLASRERQVPPSSESTASAMLRLQAERQFPPELKDLVFDYAGKADPSEARQVLLLAAGRGQVEGTAEAVRLAGLTPVAVTPTALALSAAAQSRTLLSVTDESSELVVRSENGPRVLRHLAVTGAQLAGSNGVPSPGVSALGSELMRTISVSGNGLAEGVTLFDGVGLEDAAVSALSRRANMAVSPARDLAALQVSGGTAEYAPAVALALAGLRPGLLAADFLHTRLAPPKERRLGRKVVWGAVGAIALIVLVGYPIYDLTSTQSEIDNINAELAGKQKQILAAEEMAAKVKIAEGWYDTKPQVLEALKHVTEAFPQEGTIWATTFTLRESGKGTMVGKAVNRSAALAVRDFMMNDKRFSEVQLSDTHEGGGGAANSRDRDTSFTITFTFKDTGEQPS